ncbi:MAG: Coenzyme F420 hydrogenase/dehydrogenase, beta subunit C-terminal domain [Rikenellaceae bacterium]
MINISKKEECCGCEACRQICPQDCITMTIDNEGFLYPMVDEGVCVDCGACQRVCPVLHQADTLKPLAVYGAKSNDGNIRKNSSSGGMFRLLAIETIENGGVVFGARFDSSTETIVHDYTQTIDGIAPLQRSKYVQSVIGDNFIKAKEFLKQGKRVLFAATPCQIAALRLFLNKEYENLTLVDFVCHGVPSPGVFARYIGEIKRSKKIKTINNINFRSKKNSWRHYDFLVDYNHTRSQFSQSRYKNPFLKGFFSDLYLRPSCHSCPSKGGKSGSDITLADFWGVENIAPIINDDMGVSLVMISSPKGDLLYNKIEKQSMVIPNFHHQGSYMESSKPNPQREFFFNQINNGHAVIKIVNHLTRLKWQERLMRAIRYLKSRVKNYIKSHL